MDQVTKVRKHLKREQWKTLSKDCQSSKYLDILRQLLSQSPNFMVCESLPADFLTMAEDFLRKNRPCVLESLPKDTAHNHMVSGCWLLRFLQCCK